MSIISWGKPKQVNTPEVHAEQHSSDSGIPGTYVPNMSKEDQYRWKGKIRGQRSEAKFAELRKSFSRGTCYAQVLIIVAVNGYKLSAREDFSKTKDVNVRISTNGPIALTLEEWADMFDAVTEAAEKIQED